MPLQRSLAIGRGSALCLHNLYQATLQYHNLLERYFLEEIQYFRHTVSLWSRIDYFEKFALKAHVRFVREGGLSGRKRVSVDPALKIKVGSTKTEEVGCVPWTSLRYYCVTFTLYSLKTTTVARMECYKATGSTLM
jgi:hypothetical protein